MNKLRVCAVIVGWFVCIEHTPAQGGSLLPLLPGSTSKTEQSPGTKPTTKTPGTGTTPAGGHLVLEKKEPFGEVLALAFSSDGKYLASGHRDRMVLVWNVQTGKEVVVLKEHKEPVHAVAFSPDGTLLATGSDDRTIKLWAWGSADSNPPQGKLLETLEGHQSAVRSLAFSPDGKTLASGGSGVQGGVKLWDVAGRKERFSLNTLAKGSAFGSVPISLGTVVGAVTFSSDNKLVGANCGHVARVWDVATGREKISIGPFGHWAGLSPSYLLIGSRNQDYYIAGSAAFTTDNKSLITTWCHQTQNSPSPTVGYYIGAHGPGLGWKGPLDCSPLKIWSLSTRQGRSPIQFRQQEVLHIDKATKQPKRVGLGSDGVLCFAYASDGKMIATGGTQLPLSGKESRFEDVLNRVEMNRTDYHNVVKLWETAKGRPLAVLSGHKGNIRAMAFSPNREWVASGSFDIRLWNVARVVAENAPNAK